jgi:class 3 adenylate cyclase
VPMAPRGARGDALSVDCPHCGLFSFTGSAAAVLRPLVGTDRTLIGHALRRRQQTEKRPMLTSYLVQEILQTETLPTPTVQADNLIRWLGEHVKSGAVEIVTPETHGAILGTTGLPGLQLVLSGLEHAGLIEWTKTLAKQRVRLTLSGWSRYEELRSTTASHRHAAILATDIVGYTKLMAKDENATLAARSACMSAVRKAVERNRRRLVKTIGDGTLNEFGSTVEAMRATLEILGATVAENRGKPDDKCVELRMGLAVGDIVPEGDDILGDSVNLAARLQAEASPGTICTTEHVRDDLANKKMELTSEDLGPRELKGIGRPVRVVQITLK